MPLALPRLQQNLEDNTKSCQSCHYSVVPLIWGKDLDKFCHQNFNYIFGADIIYDESTFDDLLETLEILSKPNTIVILAVTYRYSRDRRFMFMLKKSFIVQRVFYDTVRNVHIYKCHKAP